MRNAHGYLKNFVIPLCVLLQVSFGCNRPREGIGAPVAKSAKSRRQGDKSGVINGEFRIPHNVAG